MDKEQKRRALLKAGAAGCMIATLPSGAALANGSAHGCLMSAEERTAESGDNLAVIMPERIDKKTYAEPTADEYLRVRVPWGRLRVKGDKSFRVEPVYKIEDGYFDAQRNKYSGEDLKFRQKGYALVALVFRPDPDYSDVEFIGVWPNVGLEGNSALNGSCWTSLSPDAQMDSLV